MKKNLFLSMITIVCMHTVLSAQTTETYVVADNGDRMWSCSDTLMTLAQIIHQRGIRDLNDPNDNTGKYKMYSGEDEITGSIKYSDYVYITIRKFAAPETELHRSIDISLEHRIPPVTLFIKDTLRYVVDKGNSVSFRHDYLFNLDHWAEQDDVSITEKATGIKTDMSNNENFTYWTAGKGIYKINMTISACSANDYFSDSMYVVIEESPCSGVQLQNVPSVCRDENIDITPYVYLDNHLATSAELADMTFWNRSNVLDPDAGAELDPTDIDMREMADKTTLFPTIEIVYQPNTSIGTCTNYTTMLTTKVPSKIPLTEVVRTKHNTGRVVEYKVDTTYYGFNDIFYKGILQKIYLDYYNVYAGTIFTFYSDPLLQQPVSGDNLSPGTYYIVASNPACTNDTTRFKATVKNKEFDIAWFYTANQGKGYITFTAPYYPGATYEWIGWSGSLIGGHSNTIKVYYSEDALPATSVSCTITLPAARTTGGDGDLRSAVYLMMSGNATKEIQEEIALSNLLPETTGSCFVYPNPSSETFAVTGNGLYELNIYNTMGQLVYANKSYEAGTLISIKAKGMHILYLNQQGAIQNLKVVLQ